MKKYKRYLDINDDEAITKRTAVRYKIRRKDSAKNHSAENHQLCHDSIPISCHHETDYSASCEVIQDELARDNEYENEDISNYLRNTLFVEETTNGITTQKKCENLQEFMESEEFLRTITTSVDKTVGEVFFMILQFSITNSLSVTALTNLINLINNIFVRPILPDSRYAIDKLLNPQCGVTFHAVCHRCSAYIGKFQEIQSIKQCHVCEIDLELSNPSNTSFFVIIDPSVQVSDLLKLHGSYYNFVLHERQHEPGHVKDIYDGKMYRDFVKSLNSEERYNYVSAIFNTDGAPKFKCSQYSIWPIYLMLNELPPQERMNNLVTCGLWFNKKKPDMAVFLNPFVDMVNRLTNVTCTIDGNERSIKLHIISCCVDSSARAPVQGIKQYNGYYSCGWCLHPGVFAEGCIRFDLLIDDLQLREDEVTVEQMLNANPENPVYGIKHASPLINLPSFKIISGFVPDYLHCYLEGVAKQFTEYYVASMTTDEIENLDIKLNNIAAPCQISRLTRPISVRKDWKAREWENFVLYYSVPLFSSVLSKKLLDHWLLLVRSLYILLKLDIHIDELNAVDEMLHKFVSKSQEYFGLKSMTYNVHQLLHISNSVLNFGPLWTQSTFSFESANHYLLKAIKCARGVPHQIIRYVHINHSALILQDRIYPDACDIIKIYCDDILSAKIKKTSKIYNITYFGKGFTPTDQTIGILQLSENTEQFFKIVKDGCLYESHLRSKRRSNNSFAQLKDGSYVRLCMFIADEETKKEYTACNIIKTTASSNKYPELQLVKEIQEVPVYIPTCDIKTICTFINFHDKKYLCAVPNLLHY